MVQRTQVFISYSHADSEWLNRLQTMLIPLQRQGTLEVWADTNEDSSQGPLLVVIPGDHFLMGSPTDEPGRRIDERQHEMEVAPFALGKYTVMFEEYDRFAEVTRRDKPADNGWVAIL